MFPELTQKHVHSMLANGLEKERQLWKRLTLSETTPITCEHRSAIVEWMSQICSKFEFYPEACSLAVSVLHKFLSLVKMDHKYLKCAALTCVHIAAKITHEDEAVPHIIDLVHLTKPNCIVADVVRMEMIILNKLEWDVNLATPLHFLQVLHAHLMLEFPQLLKPAQAVTPGQHLSLLTRRLEACMMCRDAPLYPPSILAVSLLSLELQHIRTDWFPLTISLLSLINVKDFSCLISCREALFDHLQSISGSPDNCPAAEAAKMRQQKRPAGSHADCNTKRKANSMQPELDDIYCSIRELYDGAAGTGSFDGTLASTPSTSAGVIGTPED